MECKNENKGSNWKAFPGLGRKYYVGFRFDDNDLFYFKNMDKHIKNRHLNVRSDVHKIQTANTRRKTNHEQWELPLYTHKHKTKRATQPSMELQS